MFQISNAGYRLNCFHLNKQEYHFNNFSLVRYRFNDSVVVSAESITNFAENLRFNIRQLHITVSFLIVSLICVFYNIKVNISGFIISLGFLPIAITRKLVYLGFII